MDNKKKRRVKTVEERFMALVDKKDSGCWLWAGKLSVKGYGRLSIGTPPNMRRPQAHRLSYELFVGEIPEGMQVDHKLVSEGCPRHCVNPEHLRLVTHKENMENRQGAQRRSTSGHRGVFPRAGYSAGGWYVAVVHNWKRYKLTGYEKYELHVAAYYARKLRNELHTHSDMDK